MMREKTKEDMFIKRLQHEKLMAAAREERDSRWKQKTKHSPFAVNLVAEDERITEENSIRIKEETDRRTKMEARKQKAKNEIILKALSEFSDLEALRKEKRAIMDEEQRLKALLSLEKVRLVVYDRASVHSLLLSRSQHMCIIAIPRFLSKRVLTPLDLFLPGDGDRQGGSHHRRARPAAAQRSQTRRASLDV
jgi:hypothetical protein